jgi:hypothetical protein
METAPIESGAELYREMGNRGLHLRQENGRDNALIAELAALIRCPDEQLMRHLKRTRMSAEDFLKAFLKVTQPFAMMFQEIWRHMSKARAPVANETVLVRFGFDKDDSTSVDLEQFRVFSATIQRVMRQVLSTHWNREALDALFGLCKIISEDKWLRPLKSWDDYKCGYPYEFLALPAPADEFEKLVATVHQLFQKIVDDYVRTSDTAEETRGIPELQEVDGSGEEDEELRHAARLLHDLLPCWIGVFDRVQVIPAEVRARAVKYHRSTILPLLRARRVPREVLIREALDMLELPFWQHRWHTYEVWASVATLAGLADFRPRSRVVEGRLPLDGYSREVIADLTASDHDSACVVIQLETEFRRGKRFAIKPDLSVCFDDAMTAESRAAVVEFKQRQRLTESHATSVGQDYYEGSPKAGGVIILNYDDPPITGEMPEHVVLVQRFRPDRPEQVRSFETELAGCLHRAGLEPPRGLSVALLDVSASMGNRYRAPGVQDALRMLAAMQWIKILRFNDGLLPGGDMDQNDIAKLATSGGTDLANSLEQAAESFGEPDTLLLVTDGGYGDPGSWLTRIRKVRECGPEDLMDALDWLREPA